MGTSTTIDPVTGTAPTGMAPAGVASAGVPSPARRGTGPNSWTSRAGRTASVDPAGTSTPTSTRSDSPRLRQLIGVCGWAAVLGGVGLVIGIRGLIGLVVASPRGWFEPTMIAIGTIGIGLTVGAFITVNRRRTPWILLSFSSVALVVAMVLTAVAFS